jgi:hypothetical protein
MYMWVDFEEMPGRETVFPFDVDRRPPPRLDDRTGILAFIAPYFCGHELGMKLLRGFHHANAIAGPSPVCPIRRQSLRDWQGINVSLQCAGGAIFRSNMHSALCLVSVGILCEDQCRYGCSA